LEIKKREDRISALTGALENHLVGSEAIRAIAEEKGEPELLLHHVRAHVKMVEKDGKFTHQVVGPDGTPRVDGQGNPISIKALVVELKKEPKFARAFDGVGHSGSGARPGGGGGGALPAGTKPRSQMTITEKTAF